MLRKIDKHLFLFLVLLLCGGIAGCAQNRLAHLLPRMGNMYVARHYLGEPTRSASQADGSVRHEWLLDREVLEPAQYKMEKVYLGHDSDGFPEYAEVEVYVREKKVRQTCRVRILADKEGKVLHTESEGNSCEALLRVPAVY